MTAWSTILTGIDNLPEVLLFLKKKKSWLIGVLNFLKKCIYKREEGIGGTWDF